MSSIFRERKVPRHLIILEEHELRAGSRRRLSKWLLGGLILGVVVLMILTVPPEWAESIRHL